jgi:hypothetical protein
MKIPIPAVTDPTQEQLMNSLSKHGINFYNYSSAYEKSSIAPNYTLSKLTIEIFERNSYFVPEYPKYKNQLKDVIQKHLGNGSIRCDGKMSKGEMSKKMRRNIERENIERKNIETNRMNSHNQPL